MLNSEYAFIPLIGSAVLTLLVFAFLVVIMVRKTAKVSFVFFLALAALISGMVFTYLNKEPAFLYLMTLLASLLMLPYAVLKAFLKQDERTKKSQSASAASITQKRMNIIYEDEDISLLDVNRQFIFTTAESFNNPQGLPPLLENFGKKIVELTHADGVLVVILDDFEDVLNVKNLTGNFIPCYEIPENIPHKPQRVEMNMRYMQFDLKDNIFGKILSAKNAEMINEPNKDSRIFKNGDEDFLKPGAYIFVPLYVNDSPVGVMALSKNPESGDFTEAEFDCAKRLGDFVASSVKATSVHNEIVERFSLAKEGEIANNIQKQLIPAKIPSVPGMSIGTLFNPAENICGDYYDIMVPRKDRISFVMADVTGKSLNSMNIMLQLRALVRLLVNTTQTAGTILTWANRGIASENNTVDHFASVALVIYDSINKKIQYSSGGTNPIFIYGGETGELKTISGTQEPVGVEKNTEYADKEISVNSGDIIITCTDGLLEALNGDGRQYSKANLEKVVKQNHSLDGKAIANKIKDDVKKFCGNAALHDDQSLLVIKIK
ncbi:MAG: serine/threonine-protein phosphatase [Treponema sp.]|uniref:GAF domain-containing SpoIIE family protein phosphatase n=1 Tax=Treponema sp. TaxID=166 RepID=UPI00298DECC0|nr:PP2C family protein-serine/threonine phosphatase [Treponema sp.]MBR5934327.1 serine/threonine-protein phosphatase [Treponema sp.]